MLVYGYTEGKLVVPADLPIELIARLRIDPWRLDLFDPEPARVRCKIGSVEETLSFRKLLDFSFAYQMPGEPTFVCIHDRSGEHCAWSNKTVIGDGVLRLKNFQSSLRPFHEHLAEYLQLLGNMNQMLECDPPLSKPELPEFALYKASHKPFTNIQGAELVFFSGRAWTHSDSTGIPSNPLSPDFQFAGEMFTALPVASVLPDEINWALERFKQWKPVVIGEGLRPFQQHLKKEVFLLFDETDYSEALNEIGLAAEIKQADMPYFVKGDWRFSLFCKDNYDCDPLLRFLLTGPCLSIDMRQCVRANELQTSRICLFDLAMGQTRMMHTDAGSTNPILPAEGLKYIPFTDEVGKLDAANLARPA